MLDVCLLGTGGTVPLPERWLTSCLLRFDGQSLLIDCGEGTQIALHEAGYSCKHIDTILLTHYHSDHTAGLPGLLLSMAKAARTEAVDIYGPKGLAEILHGVKLIARYIPFEVRCHEFDTKEEFFEIGNLKVNAFAVRHSIVCYSYAFQIDRKPKFDREKAEALGIPMRSWSFLQKGQNVECEGIVYTPDMVLGEARKGIRMVYSTDTRPLDTIAVHAMNADLLIGEGMYGDPEKEEKAKLNRHSTMYETAVIAKRANVKELWLTHYSPSMPEPEMYKDAVMRIFKNTVISHDGITTDIAFSDEK